MLGHGDTVRNRKGVSFGNHSLTSGNMYLLDDNTANSLCGGIFDGTQSRLL